ncbi:MAG: alpha-amylase family glycosyl hydrolase [Fidelibacterota bacterium]
MKTGVTPILAVVVFFSLSCQRDENAGLYPVPALVVEQGTANSFDLSAYKKKEPVSLTLAGHPGLEVRLTAGGDSLTIEAPDTAPALALLSLRSDGEPLRLIVRVEKRIAHTFTYSPGLGVKRIVVMGSFNDWSRSALPMVDDDGDGAYERTVYLRPERHEYKFVVDGREIIDPENPDSVSNNLGGWNSVLDLSPLKEPSAGSFMKWRREPGKLTFRFLPPADGAVPERVIALFNNEEVPPGRVVLGEGGRLDVDVGNLKNGLLRITGVDGTGRVIPENHTLLRDGEPLDPVRFPQDWHFAVLYSLMVDRFLDGDPANTRVVNDPDIPPLANFHGGDLAGILQKLEEGYFSNLGVNVIWITPVAPVPERGYTEFLPPHRKYTGYHGYWPVAPRGVDSRFGTEEELKKLVSGAHDKGIRIILDFVANHVHEDHPYFRDHRDWFGSMYLPGGVVNIRNWSEETRLTTWFDSFMPSYDFAGSPEAIRQVVEDGVWWLETFGFDGFRQDAVKHVPHRFWRTLTSRMKERFPERDFYQIGETFGSDKLIKSYVNPAELSAQFNFDIYFNARGPFSARRADFSFLKEVIVRNAEAYGPVHLMGNITSSHDQVRFAAFADGQVRFDENGVERAFNDPPRGVRDSTTYFKLANFTAFNMSLPGVPVIYYGEEIGLTGAGDPDNRRPMRFGPDLNRWESRLKERVSRLAFLRRRTPALPLGDFVPLIFDGPVMAFVKAYFNQAVLVVVNHGPREREISVEVPFPFSRAEDLMESREISVSRGTVTVALGPYGHSFIALR